MHRCIFFVEIICIYAENIKTRHKTPRRTGSLGEILSCYVLGELLAIILNKRAYINRTLCPGRSRPSKRHASEFILRNFLASAANILFPGLRLRWVLREFFGLSRIWQMIIYGAGALRLSARNFLEELRAAEKDFRGQFLREDVITPGVQNTIGESFHVFSSPA